MLRSLLTCDVTTIEGYSIEFMKILSINVFDFNVVGCSMKGVKCEVTVIKDICLIISFQEIDIKISQEGTDIFFTDNFVKQWFNYFLI